MHILRFARHVALAAAMWALCASPLIAQPRPPKGPVRDPRLRIPASVRIERVCHVRDDGRARCAGWGAIKEELPAPLADRLLQLLEAMYDEFGLDKTKSGLTSCGSGDWSTFSPAGSAGQSGRSSLRGRAASRGAAKSTDPVAALAACRSAALAETGFDDVSPDSGYDQWVDSIVARVDAQMAECHDNTNSLIADSGAPPSFRPSELMEQEFGAKWGGLRYTKLEGRLNESEKLAVRLMIEAVKSAEKKIDQEKKKADAIQDPEERQKAQQKVQQEMSWLYQLVQDFIDFIKNFDSEPTPPPTPPDTPDKTPVVSQPCPPDEPCGATCEEKQARWQRMKEMCEMSDWKAYPCVAFLRKVNGCVDATRINPGPEGDLTCPERKSKREMQRAAYEMQCKRKGWIMMPVPGTERTCVMPEISGSMPARIDLCNDPRVMPGPDQCLGPNVPLPDEGPEPPKPDPRE